MPVYAYKCRDCGTPLEVHQEFSDAPLTECPVCGGTLRKQYGSIGVTFNGSGFYRTDSRAGSSSSDGAKSAAKSESSASSSSSSDGGAKPAATSSSSSSSSGSSAS
jgi:putative FmdB family regulatory protein